MRKLLSSIRRKLGLKPLVNWKGAYKELVMLHYEYRKYYTPKHNHIDVENELDMIWRKHCI